MHEGTPRRLPPRLVDGLLVAAVATIALVGLFGPALISGFPFPRRVAIALPLALLQALVLWWRRRAPAVVLAAALAVVVTAQALGDINAAAHFGPHVAAYTLGTTGGGRRAVTGLLTFGWAVAADVVAVRWISGEYDPVLFGPTGVLVAIAWGIGRYVAVRRAYVDEVVAHARQLEADQEERSRRAVIDERRRIARDLHDQVAHQLGVVSLQTGAARRWIEQDASKAASALEAAERASRTALETMPSILEALRTRDIGLDRAPIPDLTQLEALIEEVAGAGVAVELRIAGDRRPLHPTVELTAYRIVQEGLTNIIKHAGDARVEVSLHFAPDRLDVQVTDDGYGLAAPSGNGPGFGLRGMRERVELIGGELDAGGKAGGGFSLRARLPVSVKAPGP